MTLRFKWFSRMVPPGFKLVYSFTGWPRHRWSLWRAGVCVNTDAPMNMLRRFAWDVYHASLHRTPAGAEDRSSPNWPWPEVQE